MDLTQDQKLLLLSIAAEDISVPVGHPAPGWLVDECLALGLVERVGRTSAWRLTPAGIKERERLLAE